MGDRREMEIHVLAHPISEREVAQQRLARPNRFAIGRDEPRPECVAERAEVVLGAGDGARAPRVQDGPGGQGNVGLGAPFRL